MFRAGQDLDEADEAIGQRHHNDQRWAAVQLAVPFALAWLLVVKAGPAVARSTSNAAPPLQVLAQSAVVDIPLMAAMTFGAAVLSRRAKERNGVVDPASRPAAIRRLARAFLFGLVMQAGLAQVIYAAARSRAWFLLVPIVGASVTWMINRYSRSVIGISVPMRRVEGHLDLLDMAVPTERIRVWVVQAAAEGKEMNAGVAAQGRYTAVIWWDTLDELPERQRRAVLAHELGHIHHRDPVHRRWFAAAVAGASWMAGLGLSAALDHHAFDDPAGYATTRIAGLYATIVLTSSATKWIRGHERRADVYALEITRDPVAFREAMVSMTRANKSRTARGGIGLCSHEPMTTRLALADEWERAHALPPPVPL